MPKPMRISVKSMKKMSSMKMKVNSGWRRIEMFILLLLLWIKVL